MLIYVQTYTKKDEKSKMDLLKMVSSSNDVLMVLLHALKFGSFTCM